MLENTHLLSTDWKAVNYIISQSQKTLVDSTLCRSLITILARGCLPSILNNVSVKRPTKQFQRRVNVTANFSEYIECFSVASMKHWRTVNKHINHSACYLAIFSKFSATEL